MFIRTKISNNLLAKASFTIGMLMAIGGNAIGQQSKPVDYKNDELGIQLQLPDKSWKLYDKSQTTLKVLLFSPKSDLVTRCTVMAFPKVVIPEGLLTREKQIKAAFGKTYKRIAYDDVKFAGRNAKRIEYESIGTRTIEWGFDDKKFFIVIQLSTTQAGWKDAKTKKQLESIRDSFQYRGIANLKVSAEVDRSTSAQVRAKRKKNLAEKTRSFELSHHDLEVTIKPDKKSLKVTDKITLKSLKNDLKSIDLYVTVVDVDSVDGVAGMTWTTRKLPNETGNDQRKKLTVSFDPPLKKNAQVELIVKTSSKDYQQSIDQDLVAEVAVLGQVRPKSTYSSHILYYPIDEHNDSSANIKLRVPTGYTALTGGKLQSQTTDGDQTVYAYSNKQRRKRILPFGFAVAKYISQTGVSKSGLRLTVYGYPGEEKLVGQRAKVATETANLFERMMGPLPWKQVRFAHVTPFRKETGVSLPGLIIISDGYFTDFSKTDMSDGNISKPDVLSLLVVADELSHQWNIYAVPLPNELGEGVSTFTNMLLIESRHGDAAYRRGIKFCQEAYLRSTSVAKNIAIADPAIYETKAYRGIVFCKTPVVLAMLRDLVGDEKFFTAWRKAFSEFDPQQDGFEIVEKAFSETTGSDLRWFFDQWFFRAGHPRISVAHDQKEKNLTVTLSQQQPGEPYRLAGVLRISGGSGQVINRKVEFDGAKTTVEIDCDFVAEKIEFDPDNKLLKEMVPPKK